MNKKLVKILFIILGILLPIIVITILGVNDVAEIWNSWGKQTDGTTVKPDWTYLLLLLYKFSLYLFPAFLFAVGLSIENKKQITKKRYTYYLLTSLNIWFLVLLIIKLFADSIFEIDRIFGIAVFNSIKDVQTLIGFVLTVILKRTIKIEANQLYEKPKTQVKAILDDENK